MPDLPEPPAGPLTPRVPAPAGAPDLFKAPPIVPARTVPAIRTTAEVAAANDLARARRRDAFHAVLFTVLVIPLVWAALWNYQQEIQDPSQRLRCLIAWLIAGAGATACLCAAMVYVNRIRAVAGLRWVASLPLLLVQRGILIGQLAASGLALVSVGLMIFEAPIPPPGALLHPHVTALPEGRPPPVRSQLAPRQQLSTRPQSAPSMPQRLRQLFGE